MFLREWSPHAIVVTFVAKHLIARVEQVCEQAERQQNLPGNDTPIAGMWDIRLPGNETLRTGNRDT